VPPLLTAWVHKASRGKPTPETGPVGQPQLGYRDPANTSGQTSGLSDAVEIVVCP